MATRGTSEDFMNVCDRELGIDDFYDVYDEIKPLSAHWKQIAISFRLRINTINTIEAKHNGKVLNCLQEVIECWLKKDYDYERHCVPCWRKVCVAVKEGADDSALADEIAQEHPATGGATPHTRTTRARGAGSTASISTPSIYVPQTITDFELHRELFEIQEQFAEAVQHTIKYYSQKGYKVPEFIDYITAPQAVRKEFKEITTIRELFDLLQDKYTSWFKHEPISKLVYEKDVNENPYEDEDDPLDYMQDEFIDPDYIEKAVRYWSRYQSRLYEYFEKCITVADPASYGITDAPSGKQIMVVKVDRGDYNQNDVYFLRRAIPPHLDKPNLKLYLCQVLSN
uniref:Death domain-containing protein n=1 Tax=Amphimedon queenslandica TaxID=400682 RepID=A0A1X7U679_AMPQE